MSIVFYLIGAYLLYNLIFRFIIPIYRTTRQMRRTFKNMQEGMRGAAGNTGGTQNTPVPDPVAGKGEYIDFEEVKE